MEKNIIESRALGAKSVINIAALIRDIGAENPNFKKDEEFARKIIPNAGVWYGVKMPSLHLIAKTLARNGGGIELAKMLYLEGSHDCRLLASLLLYYSKQGQESLSVIRDMLAKATNWAVADSIAIFPLGSIIVRNPALISEMARWREDKRTWVRRSSVTSLLALVKKGHSLGPILAHCEPLMRDPDPDVQKGVSWILNEVTKRDQNLAYNFVKKWSKKADGNTKKIIRRGLEKLERRVEIRAMLK